MRRDSSGSAPFGSKGSLDEIWLNIDRACIACIASLSHGGDMIDIDSEQNRGGQIHSDKEDVDE